MLSLPLVLVSFPTPHLFLELWPLASLVASVWPGFSEAISLISSLFSPPFLILPLWVADSSRILSASPKSSVLGVLFNYLALL